MKEMIYGKFAFTENLCVGPEYVVLFHELRTINFFFYSFPFAAVLRQKSFERVNIQTLGWLKLPKKKKQEKRKKKYCGKEILLQIPSIEQIIVDNGSGLMNEFDAINAFAMEHKTKATPSMNKLLRN